MKLRICTIYLHIVSGREGGRAIRNVQGVRNCMAIMLFLYVHIYIIKAILALYILDFYAFCN